MCLRELQPGLLTSDAVGALLLDYMDVPSSDGVDPDIGNKNLAAVQHHIPALLDHASLLRRIRRGIVWQDKRTTSLARDIFPEEVGLATISDLLFRGLSILAFCIGTQMIYKFHPMEADEILVGQVMKPLSTSQPPYGIILRRLESDKPSKAGEQGEPILIDLDTTT